MGDCGLTLPCDRHFRISWWCQLMCCDTHGPAMNCGPGWWSRARACGQNAAIPPLHSSLCGLAVVAAACSLLWCRRCPTASIMEDEWLSPGTDQLRLLLRWCFLLPWRLVWKAGYCGKCGCKGRWGVWVLSERWLSAAFLVGFSPFFCC